MGEGQTYSKKSSSVALRNRVGCLCAQNSAAWVRADRRCLVAVNRLELVVADADSRPDGIARPSEVPVEEVAEDDDESWPGGKEVLVVIDGVTELDRWGGMGLTPKISPQPRSSSDPARRWIAGGSGGPALRLRDHWLWFADGDDPPPRGSNRVVRCSRAVKTG